MTFQPDTAGRTSRTIWLWIAGCALLAAVAGGGMLAVVAFLDRKAAPRATSALPPEVGTWQPLNSPNLNQRFVFIAGGTWIRRIQTTNVEVERGTYRIDWTREPATIDFGEHKGIIRMEQANRMQLAFSWAAPESARPKAFTPSPAVEVWSFNRVSP